MVVWTCLFNLGIITSLGAGKLWIQTSSTLPKKLIFCHTLFKAERMAKCMLKAMVPDRLPELSNNALSQGLNA